MYNVACYLDCGDGAMILSFSDVASMDQSAPSTTLTHNSNFWDEMDDVKN